MHFRLTGRLTAVQATVETADGGISHLKILTPLLQEFTDGITDGLMQSIPLAACLQGIIRLWPSVTG